jgi:hypothetical protein
VPDTVLSFSFPLLFKPNGTHRISYFVWAKITLSHAFGHNSYLKFWLYRVSENTMIVFVTESRKTRHLWISCHIQTTGTLKWRDASALRRKCHESLVLTQPTWRHSQFTQTRLQQNTQMLFCSSLNKLTSFCCHRTPVDRTVPTCHSVSFSSIWSAPVRFLWHKQAFKCSRVLFKMLIECDAIIQDISFTVCPSTAASSCTNTLFVGFLVITIALMDTTEDNVSDSWPAFRDHATEQVTVRVTFSFIGCCTWIVL